MKKLFLFGIILLFPVLCFAQEIKEVIRFNYLDSYTYHTSYNTVTIPLYKFAVKGVEMSYDTITKIIQIIGMDTSSVKIVADKIKVKPKFTVIVK